MRQIRSHSFWILALSAILLLTTASFGQDQGSGDGPSQPDMRPRPNLLRELGLSTEQVRQIRMLNAELRPTREAAQRQLRESNRELDQAIYAETVDEAAVAEKLRRYQAAQAALAKINFDNELSIRKILTPDQLIRFREIRRRFAESRQNMQRQRQEDRRKRQNPGMRGPGRDAQPSVPPSRPVSRRP